MQRTITIDIETLPEDEAAALCAGESAAPSTARWFSPGLKGSAPEARCASSVIRAPLRPRALALVEEVGL
jgi:hypothetical protein